MLNNSAVYWVVAAVYGLTAVILGALGTHAFGLVPGSREAALFQHAFIYQLIHALLLIWIVSQVQQGRWLKYAANFVSFGVLLFSGGLYILIFIGKTGFSWVTPVGGVMIILAWLCLVIHGLLRFKKPPTHYKP